MVPRGPFLQPRVCPPTGPHFALRRLHPQALKMRIGPAARGADGRSRTCARMCFPVHIPRGMNPAALPLSYVCMWAPAASQRTGAFQLSALCTTTRMGPTWEAPLERYAGIEPAARALPCHAATARNTANNGGPAFFVCYPEASAVVSQGHASKPCDGLPVGPHFALRRLPRRACSTLRGGAPGRI